MALLFMDGFDHYATADLSKKGWQNNGMTIVATGGRRNGGYIHATSTSANAYRALLTTYSSVIVGVAINFVSISGSVAFLKLLDSSSGVQVSVTVNSNGSISIYRGDLTTLLGTTESGLVSSASWFFVELKVTISDTVGRIDLQVNGVNVLSLVSQDTKATTLTNVQSILLRPATNADSLFDDFYICDTTGPSPCNDFLGDVRIDLELPNADGAYSAFTPSTGTSHFALVDEAYPNTTDYNSGSGIGDRDSYGLTNLTPLVSQTIYGVQVNAAVLKDDAGSKSAATFIRSGSTNIDGTASALGTSQTYIRQIAELNPNGNIAWTEAAVNAMEAGVVVTE